MLYSIIFINIQQMEHLESSFPIRNFTLFSTAQNLSRKDNL